MYLKNKIYIIIDAKDITDSMISASMNSDTTLRYNNDKTKAILKFNTKFPDAMRGYKKYNHEEILQEFL